MKECILILDNIRSVENTGSIFRTAESLGVSKTILIGTTPTPVDRFGRKRKDFMKVSLGAEKSMNWEYQKDIKSVIKVLKDERFLIVALEQTPESKDIKDFNTPDKFALIVGNEINGVSQIALDTSDEIIEISMMGMKESLNVSVATGVTLFKLLE
ncbi:MAG: TrmH family RNA methyltransferase [bacterium]|nr:TrmH family RNA methyltransferase [bacterium]